MVRSLVVTLAIVAGLTLAGLGCADDTGKADRNVGHFNKKLKIGDPAPEFSDLEGVDGKKHSLADYKDKDVVVLVITCNHCPVAQAYQDRIIKFTDKYARGANSKVALVAINVENDEADRLDRMVERSKEAGFNFPYLYDPSQKIGRQLGATATPEFYVLDKDRKVVYMGAMDNDEREPTVNYLESAVQAALKGQKAEVAETRPVGCGIPYEKRAE